MDIKQKELSLKFYSFLCDVIGTKQVVDKRRQIFAVKDDCSRVERFVTISSGSKAEGFDLKGSDFDQMIVVSFAQVFEQLEHVTYSDENISLSMDTENVKPGFTKLLTHYPPRDGFMSDCIYWINGLPYFSSTLFFRAMHKITLESKKGYIHGPCTTTFDGMYDQAMSLYCTAWISQAQSWITRTKYSWASDEVIRSILSSGVLFVPIGSKKSPFTDLEWRISFSYAEKQLICCFNHVQLLCYALLKILLNDIIKKTFGDLLCSYFMKTIMFWLCEETDVSFWRKENMLSCFMTCFRRLIYSVDNETCLHYFIPENNLFENRFERQHKELLSKLHGLYDLGWTCLLHTETLQSFRGYIEPSLLWNISISTFLPSMYYLDFDWYETTSNAALIKKCISLGIRSKKKKRDLHVYMISKLCQYFAQQNYDDESVQGNNKVSYRNIRRSLSNLLMGLNQDAESGWLLLASFFFTSKQYHISKILIDYCLAKFTPERCELVFENNCYKLQRYIEIQNIIGVRCLKHFSISIVKIGKHSSIIPNELKPLVENDNWTVLPSIVYAHFLSFLFYCTVGDPREREKHHTVILCFI